MASDSGAAGTASPLAAGEPAPAATMLVRRPRALSAASSSAAAHRAEGALAMGSFASAAMASGAAAADWRNWRRFIALEPHARAALRCKLLWPLSRNSLPKLADV